MSNLIFYLVIIIVAITGYYIKSLSRSGMIAAILIGIFITIGLHSKGLILLGIFFLTSSLLSKFKRNKKEGLEELVEKGDRRDYSQVIANGILPALFSILYSWSPSDYWLYAFCFSIAAANSDTWASEVGTLSNKLPLSIFTFKPVPRGTSGAVSLLGLSASLGGAFLIGVASFLLFDQLSTSSLILITIVGFWGSVVDTFIGGSIQAKYQCRNCKLTTEKMFHCKRRTRLISGIRWMDNDVTNLLSILITTCIGLLFLYIQFR
jgi:uncharacterized protein (TIGR00297 family)